MSRDISTTILVVSNDPATAEAASKNGASHHVVVINDLEKVKRGIAEKSCAGIVFDDQGYTRAELLSILPTLDPSNTVVLSGPLPPIHAAKKIGEALNGHKNPSASPQARDVTLEDFVETKLDEFVRAMKGSSARSLYPILIRAVERPLIELALKETSGNQVQASLLLGMNRNTLRKKMTEFNISFKRKRPAGQVKSQKPQS